jgi:hypothetical protein
VGRCLEVVGPCRSAHEVVRSTGVWKTADKLRSKTPFVMESRQGGRNLEAGVC